MDILALLRTKAQERNRLLSLRFQISIYPEQVLGVPLSTLRPMAKLLVKECPSIQSLHTLLLPFLKDWVEARTLYIISGCSLCHSREEWELFLQTILPLLDGWSNSDILLVELRKQLKKSVQRQPHLRGVLLQELRPNHPNPYAVRVYITINMAHTYLEKSIEQVLVDIRQTSFLWHLLTIRQAIAWTMAELSICHFRLIYELWFSSSLSPNDHRQKEEMMEYDQQIKKLYRQKMKESRRIPREILPLLESRTN